MSDPLTSAPRKCPEEVRDRAIRLVRDLVDSNEDSMTVTWGLPAGR